MCSPFYNLENQNFSDSAKPFSQGIPPKVKSITKSVKISDSKTNKHLEAQRASKYGSNQAGF
tara:strand:+ start:49700 stop:49885 length:186 start_codon:yes stop_codon:yes gene_type:complete